MIVLLLVYLGGVLTIVSPCILPVLPFVFSRAEQPFMKNGLPMLIGMALSFTAVATLAAVGGAWAVNLNQYGRLIALVLLAVFAMTLLSKKLADWVAQPFVAIGNRLLQPQAGMPGDNNDSGLIRSLLLGVATGLLWAPCAGPILGLVLTGAAISGPNTQTTLLLFCYAAGAATSLAIAILVGGRLFAALKKSLGAGEWVRRGLGIAVLCAVCAILFGWDGSVLTKFSLSGTNNIEQGLLSVIRSSTESAVSTVDSRVSGQLPIEGEFPGLGGDSGWLNTTPLDKDALRGKVVLVDFWTYSCINCLRSLPYVKAWYEKYKDHGLVVIGVHAPEFAFEKNIDNVTQAVKDLGVTYPVVLDNKYAIWKSFHNQIWPAHYFIDANGHIRGHHFGEGDYAESEQILRRLLVEAGQRDLPPDTGNPLILSGIQAAADQSEMQSPETYIGYAHTQGFVSPGGMIKNQPQAYMLPSTLALNQWGLDGNWQIDKEQATLNGSSGKIAFRFRSRDLHLVLGPAQNGKPVRFRVLLDGAAPAASHGVDIDANGYGKVEQQRLYQLIRQNQAVGEHTFSIEFLDSGVQAFSFTFG